MQTNSRRRFSRLGLAFATPYSLLVGYLIAHGLIKPDPGAGELFYIYFVSYPVSWFVMSIRVWSVALVQIPEWLVFLIFIPGSVAFYYYLGKMVGAVVRKKEPIQPPEPTR